MIYYTKLNTQIGELGLIRDENLLMRITLPNEKLNKEVVQYLYPNEEVIESNSGFDDAVQQLTEYFSGSRKRFQLKYKLNISPFYLKALKQVAKVPYGETSTYRDIAQKLNNAKTARAVGTANAKNPLPIIIPCHRIINSNGNFGGYAGGLNMKKYLLKLERNN